MSWFRRSSRAPSASRPQSPTSASDSPPDSPLPALPALPLDMSKSLSSLDEQRIELLEPEEFFHDPDHVRHYREEAQFLSIMSEWEIIEHPMQTNYFSADFEEELLQQRTQLPVDSLEDIKEQHREEYEPEEKTQPRAKPQRKRKFLELLFVDNIQTGIALPSERAPPSPTSAVLCKKSRKSAVGSSLSSLVTPVPAPAPTCPQQVLKDCRIDRKQLKTEALAGSIMGAIGKCPAGAEESSSTSTSPSLASSEDKCHPGELNTCDHYDIKQFFHLDEQGNILLSMTHIVECQALGLCLQAQSRRLYRRYRRGCECADEDFCRNRGCCYVLRRLLRLLCELLAGKDREIWEFGGYYKRDPKGVGNFLVEAD